MVQLIIDPIFKLGALLPHFALVGQASRDDEMENMAEHPPVEQIACEQLHIVRCGLLHELAHGLRYVVEVPRQGGLGDFLVVKFPLGRRKGAKRPLVQRDLPEHHLLQQERLDDELPQATRLRVGCRRVLQRGLPEARGDQGAQRGVLVDLAPGGGLELPQALHDRRAVVLLVLVVLLLVERLLEHPLDVLVDEPIVDVRFQAEGHDAVAAELHASEERDVRLGRQAPEHERVEKAAQLLPVVLVRVGLELHGVAGEQEKRGPPLRDVVLPFWRIPMGEDREVYAVGPAVHEKGLAERPHGLAEGRAEQLLRRLKEDQPEVAPNGLDAAHQLLKDEGQAQELCVFFERHLVRSDQVEDHGLRVDEKQVARVQLRHEVGLDREEALSPDGQLRLGGGPGELLPGDVADARGHVEVGLPLLPVVVEALGLGPRVRPLLVPLGLLLVEGGHVLHVIVHRAVRQTLGPCPARRPCGM
mmetsp:Transcript_89179/g.273102  ORF Transcript_89179/g.273102 Transcript_89179/m.273102 type:complete len:473 (-) Transcript_89179:56-1474(-)